MPAPESIDVNQTETPGLTDTASGMREAVQEAHDLSSDFRSVAREARQINALVREHLAKGGKLGLGVVALTSKNP